MPPLQHSHSSLLYRQEAGSSWSSWTPQQQGGVLAACVLIFLILFGFMIYIATRPEEIDENASGGRERRGWRGWGRARRRRQRRERHRQAAREERERGRQQEEEREMGLYGPVPIARGNAERRYTRRMAHHMDGPAVVMMGALRESRREGRERRHCSSRSLRSRRGTWPRRKERQEYDHGAYPMDECQVHASRRRGRQPARRQTTELQHMRVPQEIEAGMDRPTRSAKKRATSMEETRTRDDSRRGGRRHHGRSHSMDSMTYMGRL